MSRIFLSNRQTPAERTARCLHVFRRGKVVLMRTGLKTIILAVALVVTALVAVAGWTRKASAPVVPYAANMGYPAGMAANPASVPSAMVNPAGAQMYTEPQTNAAVPLDPCVQPVAYTVPAYTTRYSVRTARPRVLQEAPAPVYYQERPRRKGRSTAKSVAIVGGSAGVGAAIGALAGGGKGAAIGALAGGVGGFVYDRLTHNPK
jgi:hypothetical protein